MAEPRDRINKPCPSPIPPSELQSNIPQKNKTLSLTRFNQKSYCIEQTYKNSQWAPTKNLAMRYLSIYQPINHSGFKTSQPIWGRRHTVL